MKFNDDRTGETNLQKYGIKNEGNVYWNLPSSLLYEEAIRRHEGHLAHLGPLVVRTGHHTGRSPNDKFIVDEPSSREKIWWGDFNRGFSPEKFQQLFNRLLAYIQGKDLFVQDCFAGADDEYRLPVRVVTETAWHNLFARNMFIQATPDELKDFSPEFTVINTPNFYAIPEIDGTNSEVFIIINFGKRLILIGGTQYAGEIKKSVFTVMNFFLPQRDVLSMHCSANQGIEEDTAIFFGLSGTGKTTLSTEPGRKLIGDDEIGWSERGVFNLEGGCYAKVINISKDDEPEIYETTRKFGTILENVAINTSTGRIDLNDSSLTENTRAAYPVSHIQNSIRNGIGTHPSNILMLTADAFGVLPPISKLSSEQAMYHFLSGYTAKITGTEKGVTEPKATFSPCFGAPFMALSPEVYAKILGKKIKEHNVKVWLVNTGWIGGPYGVGNRIKLGYTRRIINAAIDGELTNVKTTRDPNFAFEVPDECPGVPSEILKPRDMWKNAEDYDRQAKKLTSMFASNFKSFESKVPSEIKNAGP